MIRQFLTLIVAGWAVGGVLAAAPPVAPGIAALQLSATPVPLNPLDPSQQRVGRLRYMGGVEIKSANIGFGGLSGLRARADGWLLAVSDTGNWVGFRTIERQGRLVGLEGGVIAPILDEQGLPATAKPLGDAEALSWAADGSARVGFEQDHRIQVYAGIDPARPASLGARPTRTLRYAATDRWPRNGGGEALAALTGGGMIWFEEAGQDAGETSPALHVAVDGTTALLRYRTPPGLQPSDAVELSPGRVLVLNRSFTPSGGITAVLTVATLAADMQVVEIARLKSPLNVDNFEGVALRRDAGRTFVYLVSDDNFFGLQRNLLLKFELVD